MTARRGILLGMATGLLVALGSVAAIWTYEGTMGRPINPRGSIPSRMRDNFDLANREFLDVPAGTVHLRDVPSRSRLLPGDTGFPGSLEIQDDAWHEFFYDDTHPWLVRLLEVAVASPGTLALEVVDRPATDGTQGTSLASLRQHVEPGHPILLGFGLENVRGRLEGREDPAPPGRLRLMIAGGSPPNEPDEPQTRRDRPYPLTPSAWPRAATRDVTLSSAALARVASLRPIWIEGPDDGGWSPLTGNASGNLPLAVLAWVPRASGPGSTSVRHTSWRNGRVHDMHIEGDVRFDRTNEEISMTVAGVPTPLHAYEHPIWVLRFTLEP